MKTGALLLAIGLLIMGAEVWLAVTAPIEFIGIPLVLLPMTAFSGYMVFTEWWADVVFVRRQRRWAVRRDRMFAKSRSRYDHEMELRDRGE